MFRSAVASMAVVPVAMVAGTMLVRGSSESVDVADVETMLDVSVSIATQSHVTIDAFGDSVWRAGSGSGFVVSTSPCRVWTNHHVVKDAAVIRISGRGEGPPVAARVVASTQRPDLAVLEPEHCNGFRVAALGSSDTLRAGQRVFAVGNPFGRNPDSVSSGIISHRERFGGDAVPYLQTDASINPGNSGGALFDAAGRVVGMNTAIASTGDKGSSGVGYALPIDLARNAVAKLGRIEQGWGDLALDDFTSDLNAEEATLFGLRSGQPAIIVTADVTSGPAAGVLLRHDIVVDVAGEAVSDRAHLKRIVSAVAPASTVDVGVVRAATAQRLTLVVANGLPSPEEDQEKASDASAEGNSQLGMKLEVWEGRDKVVGHIRGPVVASVHDLGPAHLAGIQSSQRGLVKRGPYMLPSQLTVTALTGMVIDGKYQSLDDIAQAEQLAASASANGSQVLVEVELWMHDREAPEAALGSRGRAFYALRPAPQPLAQVQTAALDVN